MGLCKCPKRKVTNLFCFEHRVNVCESCLLSNHEACVVQTYLSWLTDSDYDVNCPLCFEPLTIRETLRLKCLHLFHWDCLDARVRQLPDTTAPAGYKCPSCLECIFPRENQQSPIVDRLINKLQTVNWGRNGLGMSFLPELEQKIKNIPTPPNQNLIPSVIHNENNNPNNGNNNDYLNEMQISNNVFTARSKLLPESNNNSNTGGSSSIYIGNEDDSKYAKRAASEHGIRYRYTRLPRSVKRILLFLFILVFGYFLLSIFLSDGGSNKEVGGEHLNKLPGFDDPHANPNVKVGGNNGDVRGR
uniref:Zinc finger protein-like 1 homolog n=1 Tax=Meloidogyne enterolobii TaxID=390850 RepID=A0A6V7U723_MELEN|nr:unnamed protein product [Meloidogyne enterolobii]